MSGWCDCMDCDACVEWGRMKTRLIRLEERAEESERAAREARSVIDRHIKRNANVAYWRIVGEIRQALGDDDA